MKSPDTTLTDAAPRLLDELNANPTLGGVCYAVIVQSSVRAFRLGKLIEGIRFSFPVVNGKKIMFSATYSGILGPAVNPISRQTDLETYLSKKNGTLADAVKKNGEYIKLFTALVELLKSYAASHGKPYSDLYADNAGMSPDDVFFFDIRFAGNA